MDTPAEESATRGMGTMALWMAVVHEVFSMSCQRPVKLVPLYAGSLVEVEHLAQAWLERHPGYELEDLRAYPGGFAVTGRTWLEGKVQWQVFEGQDS